MPVDNGVSKGRQRYKNCVKKKLGNGSTINGTSSLKYFFDKSQPFPVVFDLIFDEG